MAEWGKEAPASISKVTRQDWFDWFRPNLVYIAEYYKVEKVNEKIYRFQAPDDSIVELCKEEYEDEDQEKVDYLIATGHKEIDPIRRKTRRVHKYIMDGEEVLEDCGYIPGKNIPIIPFYGKRWFIDGVERCMGHVRLAKDAQRLENMLRTLTAELAVNFKTEKPIFAAEQMTSPAIANMWATDNVEDHPYLLVNSITGPDGTPQPAGPIGYTKAPNLPPAVAALIQTTEQDLSDLLGNQQAGEEMMHNQSGKAVELIQNKIDMQSYIYLDNMSKTVKRLVEVWLDMKKEITVGEGQSLKVVGPDGGISFITVGQPALDPETGKMYLQNDLSSAKLDVDVQVGPTSASRRAATVRALSGMLAISQDPSTRSILESLTMYNMEGEGLSDTREYFRRQLVQAGAVKPTPEESKKMEEALENQQPDAQTIYLQSEAEKNQAMVNKLNAEVVKTLTAAGLDQARIEEIGAQIGINLRGLIQGSMQAEPPSQNQQQQAPGMQ